MANLYKWLWSRIGGRPWTYIIRDIYHQFEWFIIIALVLGGVWMGKHLSWSQVWWAVGISTIGFLGGHLFWGTKYKPGENGDN